MGINDFFNNAMTVKQRRGAVNDFGIPANSADVVIKGRLQEARNLTLEIKGREVAVDAIFYAPLDADIREQDKVVIDGQQMEVFRVKRTRHGSGSIHHLKCELGKGRGGS